MRCVTAHFLRIGLLLYLADCAATLSVSQPECRHMPPRTKVHCPGCPRTFESESSLRRHRAHRFASGTPCQLEFQQPGRVSSWAPGPAGGPGRIQVVDLPDMYGAPERSPTPDPGDDMNPNPGFDEDDLGGPAPPPAPPAPPAQVNFKIVHTNTH